MSSLLLMSAENTKTLNFVSLEICFLGFVHRHDELFFSYLWNFIHKFISADEIHVRIRADEGRTPTHFFIYIMYNSYNTFMAGVYAEVYACKVTSLLQGFFSLVHSFYIAFRIV